jgi:multidrug efflux system outer membrane protein
MTHRENRAHDMSVDSTSDVPRGPHAKCAALKVALWGVILVAVIAGCSVGPNYKRPEIEPPSEWQASAPEEVAPDSVTAALADTAWWELFGDTTMTQLILSALHENYDVRIAAARVDELMGLYGVVKSDFYPKIGAEGSGTRGQFGVPGDPDVQRPTVSHFNVNVSAAWEIDLWGKVRRASEAARADLLATEEARRGVALSLVSVIASSYIDLLSLDRQLEIAQKTVASREASMKLFKEREDKGDASALEVSQIGSEYWLAKSQVPILRNEIARLEHALSVLLGRNPGPIPRGGSIDDLLMPVVPVGLPSELLERRPDVRAAEEQLISANARVGVAKSLYFPSISLTGLFGFASGDLSNLINSNTRIWNVQGSVFQPIFLGGEIRGQVKAAEGVKKQALYSYVQAVQVAFQDAEDALVNRSQTEEQLAAEGERVSALETYASLSRMRYDEGVTDYLEVLDAERSLFDTQLQYAQTQAGLLKSVVGIYRALAGGWVDRVAEMSYPPEEAVERRESPPAEEKGDKNE